MTSAWFDRLGVFDLETTGIDVETSRIVSAYVGVIDASGSVVESREWLCDPGVEIPEQASAVHGITTARARAEGHPAPQVVREILDELNSIFERDLALTVFNASYDLTLLDREARRYGLEPLRAHAPVIDPLVLDRAVDRYRKGKRTLEAAALTYGVDLADAHDAGADAVAAGRVAQALGQRYVSELGTDAHGLHEKQVAWSAEQDANFADYMRRTHNPDFVSNRSGWPLY